MLPFDDSRRLLGANLFFASMGAVLDVGPELAGDETLLADWAARVDRAGAMLNWTPTSIVRRHAAGASLAITAPCDGLYLATEVNEWALCSALAAREPLRRSELEQALVAAAEPAVPPAPVLEESAALARFAFLAAREARPQLRALLGAAASRGLRHVLDESALTLGGGAGGHSMPLDALPAAAAVPWQDLYNIPTALVTGSNGKTTTVRLLAACARANGWRAGYNCTDGVFIGEEVLEAGDYSGPAGARRVMREPRTQAAVLETARGGILRRGIAVSQADVAIVTNVSSDHFGEYGIDDLSALADVKLAVAAAVAPGGLLILNADDDLLVAKAAALERRFGRCPPLGWFAVGAGAVATAGHAVLADSRRRGGSTCGLEHGRLWLHHHGADHDLGPVSAMPLAMDGVAAYNVANLAAAALGAAALGIPAAVIGAVFGRFGARLEDNPGRLMRFDVNGVQVLVDYAHNPEGLRGLLTVAAHLRSTGGRLGMVLGHAGNRQDADIAQVARVAAEFAPQLVVVKENESQLRGRAPGEVPGLIRAELLRRNLPESAVPVQGTELGAARVALGWARPGDVLALPIHGAAARAAVVAMLREAGGGHD